MCQWEQQGWVAGWVQPSSPSLSCALHRGTEAEPCCRFAPLASFHSCANFVTCLHGTLWKSLSCPFPENWCPWLRRQTNVGWNSSSWLPLRLPPAWFPLFQPHWPPCCPNITPSILLPQGLCTCFSFCPGHPSSLLAHALISYSDVTSSKRPALTASVPSWCSSPLHLHHAKCLQTIGLCHWNISSMREVSMLCSCTPGPGTGLTHSRHLGKGSRYCQRNRSGLHGPGCVG